VAELVGEKYCIKIAAETTNRIQNDASAINTVEVSFTTVRAIDPDNHQFSEN